MFCNLTQCEEVMAASGGDQQSALGRLLALYIAQVGVRLAHLEQAAGDVRLHHRAARKVRDHLQQMLDRNHRQPGGQTGFLGIGHGHHQRTPRRPGSQSSGQNALLV